MDMTKNAQAQSVHCKALLLSKLALMYSQVICDHFDTCMHVCSCVSSSARALYLYVHARVLSDQALAVDNQQSAVIDIGHIVQPGQLRV